MKDIFLVSVSDKNVQVKDLEAPVLTRIKRDLHQYEMDYNTVLKREDITGEYEALSLPLSKLNEFLYEGNPMTHTTLLITVCRPENTKQSFVQTVKRLYERIFPVSESVRDILAILFVLSAVWFAGECLLGKTFHLLSFLLMTGIAGLMDLRYGK